MSNLPSDLRETLKSRRPAMWLNPNLATSGVLSVTLLEEMAAAEQRLRRCSGLLKILFPELEGRQTVIESELVKTKRLQHALDCTSGSSGEWFMKTDHMLPIAGSIKARGGFNEVLAFAEKVAIDNNLLAADSDRALLASKSVRELFSTYTLSVGSTGNLGLSIGTLAAALGFKAVVHMSNDAKDWKKHRLTNSGVLVVEHIGDYASAVDAGRRDALADPHCHFVDDEHSVMLFAGYAAAAAPLAAQLAEQGRKVDAEHPLFVYIPCGVGGAPGGITFGLKSLYGANVHCFFAEPVAAPCMLVQLAAGLDSPVSVYDIGLDNVTEADGLAVGLASQFVAATIAEHLSGVFTVTDDALFKQLQQVKLFEGFELEPSAAACVSGPNWLSATESRRSYLREHDLERRMKDATHVIWTTGGSRVPAQEHLRFQDRGAQLLANSSE